MVIKWFDIIRLGNISIRIVSYIGTLIIIATDFSGPAGDDLLLL